MLDPNRLTSGTLAGRIIRLPLRLVPKGWDVSVVRGPNRGMRWRTGSSVHGCWLGTYEHDKVEKLREHVKPGMVAFDIGANAGYYTLLLSRLVGPTGRVIAFEPFPENVTNLMHHVHVNGLPNCEVIAAAVSDRTGLAGFRTAASNSMGSISDGVVDFRIPTITLDDAVKAMGVPAPDFVKMDVEGAEGLVLAGARGLLRERSCAWFVALHGAEAARSSLMILREEGYRTRDLSGADVDGTPLDRLDEIFAKKE